MEVVFGMPPKCECGKLTRLHISKKSGENYNRCFWRCHKEVGKQCKTFWWTSEQPWYDLTSWRFLEQPHGQREVPPSEALRQMVQERCEHPEISRLGTNQFRIREKCKRCQKTIRDEPKAKDETTSTTTPTASEQEHFQKFQRYLRWKNQQGQK